MTKFSAVHIGAEETAQVTAVAGSPRGKVVVFYSTSFAIPGGAFASSIPSSLSWINWPWGAGGSGAGIITGLGPLLSELESLDDSDAFTGASVFAGFDTSFSLFGGGSFSFVRCAGAFVATVDAFAGLPACHGGVPPTFFMKYGGFFGRGRSQGGGV